MEEVSFLTNSKLNQKDGTHKTFVRIKDSESFKVPRWVTFTVEPLGNVIVIWTVEVIIVKKEMEETIWLVAPVSMIQVLEGNLLLENQCKENIEWDIPKRGWEEIQSKTTLVACGLEDSELSNELLELRNPNSCWHCSGEIGNWGIAVVEEKDPVSWGSWTTWFATGEFLNFEQKPGG